MSILIERYKNKMKFGEKKSNEDEFDAEDFVTKENKDFADKFMNFIGAIIAFAISMIPLYFAID